MIEPGESEPESDRETARIEAFSDGVFAIAITLLILEVKVPHDVAPGHLGAALLEAWPMGVAYLSGFLTIGIMWVNHHRLFTLIRRSDDRLLLYNGLLLLAVSIVPFPTALLAEYIRTADARTATTVYCVHCVLIALTYIALWRHASKDHRLLGKSISRVAAQDMWRQYRYGPLFYLVGVGLAQFSPPAALALNGVLAVFFAMPPAVVRTQVECATAQVRMADVADR